MPRRRFSVLLLILLLISVSTWVFTTQLGMQPSKAFGHVDSELSGWAAPPPTIDGYIDSSEWASAANATYMTTGGIGGVFYVMNDAVNLYMAVVTADPTLSVGGAGADAVMLYFDNDHDGVGPEPGDEILGWEGYLGEGFKDGFSDGTYVWRRDADFGGTSEGSASATNNGTHNHFEIVHPLISVDAAHDFSLRMSSSPTIGFGLRLNVDGFDKGWWASLDPASWLDIAVLTPVLSAWASTTPVIDGLLRPAVDFLDLPAEWENASKIEIILSWGAELHEAAIYVMNDYINLYLAFEIHGEDLSASDQVVFNFDNDNDGFKETQDDRLFVEGFSFFHDGFFAGLPYSDVSWGGTLDGVGAVQFVEQPSTINGSYSFEVAHPLNTSDGFDFSLRVGDAVGFNVLFLDGGGVIGDGWPTFTQEDWSQMADIVIAGPESPPEPNMNLKIRKIEITQAIQWLDHTEHDDNSLPLARGKTTVARVYIDTVALAPQVDSVSVYLYATDGASGISLVEPHLWSSNGPLDEILSARVVVDRGNENHTANFLLPPYWVDRLSLTLVAFVKAPDSQGETNYTDNWTNRQTFFFTVTKSLEIWYYLIDYRPNAPDENPNVPDLESVSTKQWFSEVIYPIPDLLHSIDYIYKGTHPWNGPRFINETGGYDPDAVTALWKDLHDVYESIAEEDRPDLLGGWYDHADLGVHGGWGNDNVFLVCYDQPEETLAHELGHGLGRSHTWNDELWPYATNETQTYGFTPYVINSGYLNLPAFSVLDPSCGDIMSYDQPHWISPYTWEKLLEALDPPAGLSASLDEEVQSFSPCLLVSGVICRNNTGSLEPVFQTSSSQNYTGPGGPYVVELRGPPPAESLLCSQNFNVSFSFSHDPQHPIDPDKAFFSLILPSNTGAYSISLWNGTALLDRTTASASPPLVTVTYPNGGEAVGSSFTINWTASDADGDPLTFKLFYSSDNGAKWRPISSSITGTSYRVDASVLPGGSQSLIRVLASDGFYTSEDHSDAGFSVPLKSPMNVVGIGVGPCIHYDFSRPVTLKGSAFDPEDGMLNGTALIWTSDLNGTLGTGTVLAVADMIPGIHNITLAATDSQGNNATYSFTVTVEFHDIAVTDAIVAKSVVGQGCLLRFTVAIENQGNVPESFNVTLYANLEPAMTEVEVSDVLSGSTAVITLEWDTSGFNKGNYSMQVVAEAVPRERDRVDNTLVSGWVFVTIPGDTDSDRDVDIFDIVKMAGVYGVRLPDSRYDPNCDIDGDGDIDIFDIVIAASHYGESW